jgi:hypothetical protein
MPPRARRVALALLVAAAPTALPRAALAAPCAAMKLSDYVALSDCTIGIFTFKGFDYDARTTGIDAMNITVTPVSGPGGVGFRFTFPDGELSSAGQARSLVIGFSAMDTSADPKIRAAMQTMQAQVTGSGVAEVVDPLPLSTRLQAGVTRLESEHVFPSPVHSVAFSARVTAETGVAVAGTSLLSAYTQTVKAVPEPSAAALVLGGALALAAARRRPRRR